MENKYYVYEWYVVETDEVFYVGKGCEKRAWTLKRNKFFLDMYNTHNCGVRIVQDNLYEDDAYQLEYETIQWYKTHTDYRLTNQTEGGDGTLGYKLTPEQIEKMTLAIKEKWRDKNWRQEIIRRRHLPDSTYQSEEFKRKISSLVQGENNPNYGHRWTDEMKDALSIKQIESHRYDGFKNPNAKQIQCIETEEIFDCITEAMQKYNVKCAASFTVALQHPTRTAAGLHWKYIQPLQ